MPKMHAFSVPLRSGRLGLVCLALTVAVVPACKKGKKSKNPKEPQDRVEERFVEEAVSKAKSSKLIEIANADLKNGRYVSATRRAEEALAENPENADAHAILGAARWRAGDYAGSTAAYEKSLEHDPKNFGASLGLARNLAAAGNHARAIELQEALLAEDKEQIDPRLTKLWSYYATADAANAVKELDEIFKRLPAEDPLLPLVQAYASFLRPLADAGPLCEVVGTSGSMDAGISHDLGMKYGSGIIGGEFSRVVFFENVEEAVVDKALVAKLKLKSLGKMTPLGQSAETDIVLVPEIKFGELTLKNVPALVQVLAPYEEALGETPGIVLGRQAMQAFGSITFDFPAHSLVVTKDPPPSAPAGTAELPFLLISMHVSNAPAVPVKIDGSEHEFFVFFGGVYNSALAFTKKEYLKSGHLPREVAEPEDAENGWKMVYVDSLTLGESKMGGSGGLVFVNTPPDINLASVLRGTEFELGGYINTRLMASWVVTYAIPTGKVYVKLPEG
jgi:tetratricopeptide (TPR) repeat protein